MGCFRRTPRVRKRPNGVSHREPHFTSDCGFVLQMFFGRSRGGSAGPFDPKGLGACACGGKTQAGPFTECTRNCGIRAYQPQSFELRKRASSYPHTKKRGLLPPTLGEIPVKVVRGSRYPYSWRPCWGGSRPTKAMQIYPVAPDPGTKYQIVVQIALALPTSTRQQARRQR